jgi:UDP-2-acetamido-3-amino-2,3-dideoxy-glucuronate N-acetyltransferase
MAVKVHPQGLCESDQVGDGTRVWAFAHVLPGAVVGKDCNICDCAFIEDGAVLGDRVTVKNAVLVWRGVTVEDDVFLGPNVLFTNDLRPRSGTAFSADDVVPTMVRRGASLGAGVVVVCGTEIGEYAFAGAGAVITRDVAPQSFVAGNPAVHKGWVCRCGARLTADADAGVWRCTACGTEYGQDGVDGGPRQLPADPAAG